MDGMRLAAKGVASIVIGALVYLFGLLSMSDAQLYMILGALITAGGGVVVGLALGNAFIFGGGLLAAVGTAGVAAFELRLDPQDGPMLLYGGLELAVAGLGVGLGAWLRTIRSKGAPKHSGALGGR